MISLKYKQLLVVGFILAAIVCSNLFFTKKPDPPGPYGTDMVGSKACQSCHADIYKSHIETAHYRDSRPAETKYIKGSFQEGKNVFNYNPFMSVAMLKDGKRLVQSAQVSGTEVQRAYFDIVIGSGRKGQSYLSWMDNSLYQLPISYYAETNTWCNSPGFPKMFKFDRGINLACLECHTTYAKAVGKVGNDDVYDKAALVLGIDCERCHGGGGKHVSYHLANVKDTVGRYIVNTARMERGIRVDGCALCHSGIRKGIEPPFTFQVGDTLSKYSQGNPISDKADTLDVHGNQFGLMAASKCYIKSAEMDCSSCHNVHKDEFNKPKIFNAKCMTCHGGKNQVHCSLKPEAGLVLENKCIDCHMPILSSNAIRLDVNGKETLMPDRIRTHYISIYKNLNGSASR
jgi:hypothetical protein